MSCMTEAYIPIHIYDFCHKHSHSILVLDDVVAVTVLVVKDLRERSIKMHQICIQYSILPVLYTLAKRYPLPIGPCDAFA